MTDVQNRLRSLADKKIAVHSQRFFKTGKGEYGEGDLFLGVRVPELRKLAKEYQDITKTDLTKLIKSKWHEERLLGLLIVVFKYQKTKKKDPNAATVWYEYYLKHFKYINNWDLVDTTCHKIIGPELIDSDRDVLYEWANSSDLWIKRIAMMSTYYFIQNNEFKDTLKIAKILRDDEHDLIHKVVGWMLREVGKKDKTAEDKFLRIHYKKMPRTMLRYAIEKYPEKERQKILKGIW